MKIKIKVIEEATLSGKGNKAMREAYEWMLNNGFNVQDYSMQARSQGFFVRGLRMTEPFDFES